MNCTSVGERADVYLSVWKPFIFSFSTEPISNILGTKHPLVKGIQVCSHGGPRHFSRGDNNEIARIHWRNLIILFWRNHGLITTKLGTNHPWVKRMQAHSNNEEPRSFPRGDNPILNKETLWYNHSFAQ